MKSIFIALAALPALLMAAPAAGADAAPGGFGAPKNVEAKVKHKAEKPVQPPPKNKAMKTSPKLDDVHGGKGADAYRGDPCSIDPELPGCTKAKRR